MLLLCMHPLELLLSNHGVQARLLQVNLKGPPVTLTVVLMPQLLKTANEEDLQRLQSVPWRYGLDSPQGGSVHIGIIDR